MTRLDDATLERLRRAADAPDLSATRYEIVREMARGGMGTVYEAWERDLERAVALKVITAPEVTPGSIGRLRREARTLARLEHPGIVPVHDIGTLPDGRLYYAMKLVRGERLDEMAGRSPRAELLRIFGRVVEAVAFAHAQGVIHRDLKPQNVMVGAFGEVLVLDWGLARAAAGATDATGVARTGFAPDEAVASDDTVVTGHGAVLGTPGWMAPEQERGDAGLVDARSDVYALGALLRWMLAATPAPAPPALVAVCDRAMAFEPAARYQGADALAADVAAFVDRRRVSAYPERALERVLRVAARYRTPILLVFAYLVMRLALLAIYGRGR